MQSLQNFLPTLSLSPAPTAYTLIGKKNLDWLGYHKSLSIALALGLFMN